MNFTRKIHLWLSVPFGVLIAIISLTGAILVFEKEIAASQNPQLYEVKPAGEARPLSELIPQALASIPDSAVISGLEIPAEGNEPYRLRMKGRRTFMLDQYTGKVLGEEVRSPFFKTIHSLHGSMMAGHAAEGEIPWGAIIVGTSTLVMLIGLITGVILWWPRSRRSRRRAFRISTRKGAFRFWFSLHDAGGMYVSIFLAAMCITGLTWSFDWFNKGFYAILGASEKTRSEAPKPAAAESETDYALWDNELALTRSMAPGKVLTVSQGEVKADLCNYGNTHAADTYRFDSATGALTSVDRYSESSRRAKISGWVGVLHTGAWGGLPGRILYCIAAVAGAMLPLTGYYLWIHRLRAARK